MSRETLPSHCAWQPLLLPPLGLVLLWRSSRTLGKKLLGSLGIALFSLIYAGVVIFLLVRFCSLGIEWRGGYVPALTWHKTQPDFDALERHRAAQAATQPAATNGSESTVGSVPGQPGRWAV